MPLTQISAQTTTTSSVAATGLTAPRHTAATTSAEPVLAEGASSGTRWDAGRITAEALVSLASTAGISMTTVDAVLAHGSRLTLMAGPTGTVASNDTAAAALNAQRVPTHDDGTPDLEKIVANGGHVTGALPGGVAEAGFVTDNGQSTYWAMQVDLGDGTPPFYLKGATG